MSQIDEAEMFAEDLLIFVMNETGAARRPSRNLRPRCISSPLSTSIQFAVRRCLEENDEAVKNIFNTLLNMGDLNENFRQYAKAMSILVSMRGYRESEFVLFCGVLCRLAVLGYSQNFKSCLTPAVTSIVDAIKFYKATGAFSSDSWDKMSRAVLFKHNVFL